MAIDWSNDRTILKLWIAGLILSVVLWVATIFLAIAVGGILTTLMAWAYRLVAVATAVESLRTQEDCVSSEERKISEGGGGGRNEYRQAKRKPSKIKTTA